MEPVGVKVPVLFLLRRFKILFSATCGEERLSPRKRESRYQQTCGGVNEENLHPDPEVTEYGSSNPWDAKNGPVAPPVIYSSSGGPGLRSHLGSVGRQVLLTFHL